MVMRNSDAAMVFYMKQERGVDPPPLSGKAEKQILVRYRIGNRSTIPCQSSLDWDRARDWTGAQPYPSSFGEFPCNEQPTKRCDNPTRPTKFFTTMHYFSPLV